METNSFTLGDVLSVPIPEESQETRTYEAAGRTWEVTIRTDGTKDAERFYKLTAILGSAALLKEPLRLTLPNGTKFEATDPGFISNLKVLAEVSISPGFLAEEWGVFGQRVGSEIMNDLFDWALEANGLTAWLGDKLVLAKNALSAANPSTSESTALAGKSSTNGRKRR